jgi:protein MAK11
MDDGYVSFYDADPFVHLKSVKVHKKGVNDICVHNSGKLLLSVGKDGCLGMVNLVRGRRSFFCRIGKEASLVEYDCGGEKFFMGVEEKVSVHEAENAKLVCELEGKKRVLCMAPGMVRLLLYCFCCICLICVLCSLESGGHEWSF